MTLLVCNLVTHPLANELASAWLCACLSTNAQLKFKPVMAGVVVSPSAAKNMSLGAALMEVMEARVATSF